VPRRWGTMEVSKLGELSFGPVDMDRYPCLRLAYEAARRGGAAPAAMNAANEVAVEAFLARRIGFLDIPRIIAAVLDRHEPGEADTLEKVLLADAEARRLAHKLVG